MTHMGIRKKPGPLQTKSSFSLTQLPKGSVRKRHREGVHVCEPVSEIVTTAVRPSSMADSETKGLHCLSNDTLKAQGVLRFLFLYTACTICRAVRY